MPDKINPEYPVLLPARALLWLADRIDELYELNEQHQVLVMDMDIKQDELKKTINNIHTYLTQVLAEPDDLYHGKKVVDV